MTNENNAMQAENSINYPFQQSARCGAKTRQGALCQSPAVRNRLRCRMHGGKNNGAPVNNSNALKHGFSTKKVKQLKKTVREFVKSIYYQAC